MDDTNRFKIGDLVFFVDRYFSNNPFLETKVRGVGIVINQTTKGGIYEIYWSRLRESQFHYQNQFKHISSFPKE